MKISQNYFNLKAKIKLDTKTQLLDTLTRVFLFAAHMNGKG